MHSKPLYAAIGEPNNRNRKPVTLARAIERLMVLDAVLGERRLQWLGAEREKVEYFSTATTLRLKELPHLVFGAGPEKTIRYFPDKLPIGITGDGRTHVFLYLVNRPTPVDFRAFLHRHAELLRALPEWELRLLVPRHLLEAAPLFEQAAREELGRPLRLDDVAELRWYFRQQDQVDHGGAPEDFRRFRRACRAFRAPRFHVLYRLWKKNGDQPLDATVSPVLEDKIARRRGHVTSAGAGSCLCPSLTPGWLGVIRRSRERRGDRQGREEWSPSWVLGEAGERREARGCMRERDVPHVVVGEGSC